MMSKIVNFLTLDIARRKELRNQWYKLSGGMMTALHEAAMKCSELSDGQRMKWMISTTHDEVLNGLLNQEIDTTRGLCYIRNIKQFHKMETVDESYGKLVCCRLTLDAVYMKSFHSNGNNNVIDPVARCIGY